MLHWRELGDRDSNSDSRIQSPASCRWTISQCWGAGIRTPIAGFRDQRPAVGRHPNVLREERSAGVEPARDRVEACCLSSWLRPHVYFRWGLNPVPRLKRPVLYP